MNSSSINCFQLLYFFPCHESIIKNPQVLKLEFTTYSSRVLLVSTIRGQKKTMNSKRSWILYFLIIINFYFFFMIVNPYKIDDY